MGLEFSLVMDPDLLTGKTGEVEITRLDEEWLEAWFHFTATSLNR
jgi:hypothetical protein